MAEMTFKRYEKKYLISEDQFRVLYAKLCEHMRPDKHCRDGGEYVICNIYYDTPTYSVIRNSLEHPYYKEKMRMRSYLSPCPADGKVFLELKKKIGGIVSKRRATMTLSDAEEFLKSGRRPDVADYMTQQVLGELQCYIDANDVAPAEYISYSRVALYGIDDRDLRVTFDRNIIARQTELTLSSNRYGELLLKPGERLMEIKVSSAAPIWLCDILSEMHIYKTSFSKYGAAYEAQLIRKISRRQREVI